MKYSATESRISAGLIKKALKHLGFLMLLMLAYQPAFAQNFTITGTVYTSDTKNPLTGVNVIEVGTQNGTSTDIDGKFSLDVSGPDASIKFSYIGFQDQTIALNGRHELTIYLKEQVGQLKEMVVTAFGVEKQQKSLGYSVSQVEPESFTKARSTNVADNLSGEIAGVQVSSPQTGPAGSSRIVIRGIASLTGNNEPLIVVDGVPIDNRTIGQAGMWGGFDGGDGMSSLNPDDIKSMSVLKGPAAAALYGSRAQNGAVVITTKSGSEGQSIEGTFKTNVQFENILVNYDFQQQYGLGSRGKAPQTQQEALNNGLSSWGAKINGQQVVQFDGVKRPYVAHPNNMQNFYQTGSNITNTLALSGGDDHSSFYLSLTNLDNNDIIPTSTLDRKNINFRGHRQLGNFRAEAKANYIIEKVNFRPELSDNPANPALSLSYMPTTIDVRWLKDYQTENGQHVAWNNSNFRPNPYWGIHKDGNQDTKRRLIGYVKLNYTPNDWIDIQGRAGTDFYTLRRSNWQGAGSPWIMGGSLSEDEYRVREDNLNLLATFDHQITKDISVNGNLGANRRYERYEDVGQYGRDFVIPGLITIGNTDAGTRATPYSFNEKEVNSVFGSAQFDYKNYWFVEVTGRNDWSSTLPQENNSYFYPSINTGFTFTDAFGWDNDILSFGKIRASWAQVGGDTNPYRLNLTYGIFGSHPTIDGTTVPYGGVNNGTIPLADLKPTSTKSYELGLDLRFFTGRVNFDFTWYQQNTTNQILGTTVSNASGYGSQTINAGEISNKGVELSLSGSPIQTRDFNWNVRANFAKNINKVVSLAPGKESLRLAESRSRIAYIDARKGEPYNQIIGTGYKRNDQGQIMYDSDGLPLTESGMVLGNGTPDWTGGLTNTFNYRNFTLSALIDVQAGGDIYSMTNSQAYGNGLHKATLAGRASYYNDPQNGGVIGKGVKADGTTPNDVAVDPQVYYSRIASDVAEEFVYDASFVKLRQLSLTYNLPSDLLTTLPIKDASVSVVGRNLWILLKNTPNIDPESNYQTGNYQGLEHATLPSTRTVGFDVTLKF